MLKYLALVGKLNDHSAKSLTLMVTLVILLCMVLVWRVIHETKSLSHLYKKEKTQVRTEGKYTTTIQEMDKMDFQSSWHVLKNGHESDNNCKACVEYHVELLLRIVYIYNLNRKDSILDMLSNQSIDAFDNNLASNLLDLRDDYKQQRDFTVNLLKRWIQIYGQFPVGKGDAVERIITHVCENWASPPTNLDKLQKARYIDDELNSKPEEIDIDFMALLSFSIHTTDPKIKAYCNSLTLCRQNVKI